MDTEKNKKGIGKEEILNPAGDISWDQKMIERIIQKEDLLSKSQIEALLTEKDEWRLDGGATVKKDKLGDWLNQIDATLDLF